MINTTYVANAITGIRCAVEGYFPQANSCTSVPPNVKQCEACLDRLVSSGDTERFYQNIFAAVSGLYASAGNEQKPELVAGLVNEAERLLYSINVAPPKELSTDIMAGNKIPMRALEARLKDYFFSSFSQEVVAASENYGIAQAIPHLRTAMAIATGTGIKLQPKVIQQAVYSVVDRFFNSAIEECISKDSPATAELYEMHSAVENAVELADIVNQQGEIVPKTVIRRKLWGGYNGLRSTLADYAELIIDEALEHSEQQIIEEGADDIARAFRALRLSEKICRIMGARTKALDGVRLKIEELGFSKPFLQS